jgi:hypothetical protein
MNSYIYSSQQKSALRRFNANILTHKKAPEGAFLFLPNNDKNH